MHSFLLCVFGAGGYHTRDVEGGRGGPSALVSVNWFRTAVPPALLLVLCYAQFKSSVKDGPAVRGLTVSLKKQSTVVEAFPCHSTTCGQVWSEQCRQELAGQGLGGPKPILKLRMVLTSLKL